MWSFIISLIVLVIGSFIYGKFVENVFHPESKNATPAITKEDGVDYVPMPGWKVFMIQFLNIAGTGPIFGAIMGAKFGPSCYLWIVFGSIFAGAVHDYFTGMMSMRDGGASLPDLVGDHIGKRPKRLMMAFSLILLMLVGTVFVYSPALILGDIAGFMGTPKMSIMIWVFIIFAYYIIATVLPIDKIIGKIYPLFAFTLLFMAAALGICLFIKWPGIPEFWEGLNNMGPEAGITGQRIFPCLFITVACGAISGFHATQSPIMARCVTNETNGRPIFYGAMITEGIVALIWAAISSYFFFGGGMQEVGATSGQAPVVVTAVSKHWLGLFGGILAIMGVVAAPITSGDTAFRGVRIIIADALKLNQKSKKNRLLIAIPIFIVGGLLLWYNIADENGFNNIWRYFGWANQALAAFMLWTATIYLIRHGSKRFHYLITMIPAMFVTATSTCYICTEKIGFYMSFWNGFIVAIIVALVLPAEILFYEHHRSKKLK